MSETTPALSIVVPCFNEEDGIAELLRRTRGAAEPLHGENFEIVLIDDGSTDRTWSLIAAAADADRRIVGVKLSRNHGHQRALSAGLTMARGDLVLVLDADLQDPPELLGPMTETLRREGADVVYGQRRRRDGESRFKTASAALFYRALARRSEISLPLDTGDFRLMTARVARALARMPEQDRFVRGMVAWLGLRQVAFPYDREERFAGTTKYPLRRMLRLASDAFMGFSMVPLRFAAQFAAAMFLLLIGIVGYAVFSWLFLDTVSGWTSVMILLCFIGMVQFLLLAVIGEYVGRLYLGQKQRPLFVVEAVEGAEPGRIEALRGEPHPPQGLWL